MKMIRMLVEGWIDYPHSYSIVNLYQIIALIKRGSFRILLKRTSPYCEHWEKQPISLILNDEEQKLFHQNVKDFKQGDEYDIIYRIQFPYNIENDRMGKPVVVFFTDEFQKLTPNYFECNDEKDFQDACMSEKIVAVTPSFWSQNQRENVLVISHGVDKSKFYPMNRSQCRHEILPMISNDAFVFLTVGSMTSNKNIEAVIHGFIRICRSYDNNKLPYLVMKTIQLYNGTSAIKMHLKELKYKMRLSAKIFKQIRNQILIIDDVIDFNHMRLLYNCCDCLVAPYRAEGFNLPVLEALACGIQVIVPDKGSTIDFTHTLNVIHLPSIICNIQDDKKIVYVDDLVVYDAMVQVMSSSSSLPHITNLEIERLPTWNEVAYNLETLIQHLLLM